MFILNDDFPLPAIWRLLPINGRNPDGPNDPDRRGWFQADGHWRSNNRSYGGEENHALTMG